MRDYHLKSIELLNGESVTYRETADQAKPKLLLIHGNMSSSIHFQTLMNELEDHYHLISPDLPGFGSSTYNKEHHSLLDFAEDIESFVSGLSIEEFDVLGWSTGGGIALELAYLLPKQVKNVFLLSSVGVKGYPMFKKDEAFQPILTERLVTKEEIAADPVQVLPVLNFYATKNKEAMRSIWDAAIYINDKPEELEYQAYLEDIIKQVNLVDIDYSLVHFNITNESNGVNEGSGHIDGIQCPIVIIHGAKDMVVPLSQAELSKQAFGEQAKLHILEEAGHAIVTDNMKKLVEIIKETSGGI